VGATIDLDATIIESWKHQAQVTYQGLSGYQPMLAWWAEMDLALADDFRDGNVPAQVRSLPVTRRLSGIAADRAGVLLPWGFGLLGEGTGEVAAR
jgi:hypothetical protein